MSRFNKILLFAICASAINSLPAVSSAECELLLPTNPGGENDIEFGLVMIPGAQIKGEAYKPLALKIQSLFPGKLWLGITEGWLANFPNPIEINGAINDCVVKAQGQGLATSTVFHAGHSLGGVMLEMYIKDHPDKSSGLILFGSYLPNGLFGNGDSNLFPVPVLTAMGSLDGAGLSYATREARESQHVEEQDPSLKGQYPVLVIDRVNHAQVASGEIPDIVIEQDIDAEIDNEEAWNRYAKAAVAYMVTSQYLQFDPTTVGSQLQALAVLQSFTNDFLAPFQAMALLESTDDKYTPWVIKGQEIILGASDEELSNTDLKVDTEMVSVSDLGSVKPTITVDDNCSALVKTFSHNAYAFDPMDFGSIISAEVIKAKFKLEDVVLEGLCLTERNRCQCKDINEAAYRLALDVASAEAKERFTNSGRQLQFMDDYVSPWGPGWEFSSGLDYLQINETLIQVTATSLVSEPDFIIASAAGMHYCDLLSPYRALEWIYIKGVVHGK